MTKKQSPTMIMSPDELRTLAEPKRPGFLDEIDRAKEQVASWPQWMKDATISAAATLPVTKPKRKPLSDEQADKLIIKVFGPNADLEWHTELVRAVEEAHGIGGSND